MSPLALAIDIGNTRIKLAALQNYKVLSQIAFDKKYFDEQIEVFTEKFPNIDRIIVSDVTNFQEQLPPNLKDVPTVHLHKDIQLGFLTLYESMDTLGVDRIALMSAAAHHFADQHSLVIACGTCVTFNFLENGTTFLGGAISPGLQMRHRAMHEFTSKLPLVASGPTIELIGKSTTESLQSGAFNGLCAEIDGIIQAYEHKYGKINAVLTGGDMAQVQTRIKSKIFADANFIYEGLYHILLLNT